MKNNRTLRASRIIAIGGFLIIPIVIERFLPPSPNGIEALSLVMRQTPGLWLIFLVPIVGTIVAFRESQRLFQNAQKGEYYSALFEASPIAIVTLDTDQKKVIAINPSFEKLFGYSAEEIVGNQLDPLITSREMSQCADVLTEKTLAGESIRATEKRRRKNGEYVDVEIYGVPVKVNAIQTGALGLYHDISEREKAREELHKSEEKYRQIFENTIDYLYSHDLDGNITGANPAFVQSTGFDLDTLLSMNIVELMPEANRSLIPRYLRRMIEKGKGEGLFEIVDLNGESRMLEYKNSLIIEDGTPVGVRGSARDITTRLVLEEKYKQSLEELEKLARTDSLTGLLNRRGVYEHLEGERKRAQRLEIPLSVAMIDLDSLKYINDNFGHNTGDEALNVVATSITRCVRNYDRVGRHGGDEFLVIFTGADLDQTRKICSRIVETTQATKSSQPELRYSVSIGCATFTPDPAMPDEFISIDDALALADDALYLAKESGGSQVAYFDEGTQAIQLP